MELESAWWSWSWWTSACWHVPTSTLRPHGRSAQQPVLLKPFQIAYPRPEAWHISYLYTYSYTLTSTIHSSEPSFMAYRPTHAQSV